MGAKDNADNFHAASLPGPRCVSSLHFELALRSVLRISRAIMPHVYTAQEMREALTQHLRRIGMLGTGQSKVRGDSAYYAKLARIKAKKQALQNKSK